jgi:multiple antibiotic resistance protein
MTDFGFLVSALVMLLVTIGPVEAAAVFGGLSGRAGEVERQRMARRAVLFAGLFLGLFAIGGGWLLTAMRITIPAFQVAGGVLLFLQALTLTFANPGLSSINEQERREAQGAGDIALFPMAFPLIAGPGSMSAVVLLMSDAAGSIPRMGMVLAALAATLALTWFAMRLVDPLTRVLGVTGADVIGRISGVLLAALSVQFIFDGVAQWLAL